MLYLMPPSEPARLSEHNWVKVKRGLSREELLDLLADLSMKRVQDRSAVVEAARRSWSERQAGFNGKITDRLLWSYIRHHLTNYDEILAQIKRRVGESELYENVKVYLCCRIIRNYGLKVDPLYAAFGAAGSYGRVPERFIVENLEAAATEAVLKELLRRSDTEIQRGPFVMARSSG